MAGSVDVDVVVRGRGAVGAAAALALARRGLRVVHAGLAAPRAADPRAYALNEASRRLLVELRVWDAMPASAREPVLGMLIEGDLPGHGLEFDSRLGACEALAWIVDAAALDAALADALRFAPHVTPADGEARAPLVVVAEGRRSPTREALGVAWSDAPCGQHALAARLCAARPHRGVARQWFASPDIVALLPTAAHEGHGVALVWSTSPECAARWVQAPAPALEAAVAQATHEVLGAVRLDGQASAWPLALGRAERIAGAGWVLVGDSAHVVHPLAGQGLNLGLADVASLAEVLAGREPWRALGDERLLRRYARARAFDVAAMAALTDGLHALFDAQPAWLRTARNAGLELVDRAPPLKRWLARQAMGVTAGTHSMDPP